MVKIRRISVKNLHLKFKLLRKYHKVKYLLRVKHFRGRDVHSPFMYKIVRKALMNRRGKQLALNLDLYDFLGDFGFVESSKRRICRVFSYLELDGYSNIVSYNHTNSLVVLTPDYDFKQLASVVKKIHNNDTLVCVVVPNIYTDIDSNKLWREIIKDLDCVAVDLFYEGIIFVNDSLKKQDYKMKF